MAREFLIKYSLDTEMDDHKLMILNNTISTASNDTYTISFLHKDKENFVYGLKIKAISKHDWGWDGQIYFNLINGYMQFDTGTVQQIDTFMDYLTSILESQRIKVSAEEE